METPNCAIYHFRHNTHSFQYGRRRWHSSQPEIVRTIQTVLYVLSNQTAYDYEHKKHLSSLPFIINTTQEQAIHATNNSRFVSVVNNKCIEN